MELLSGARRFDPGWLRDGDRTVVPFPTGKGVDRALAARLARAAEAFVVLPGGATVPVPQLEGYSADGDFLLCLPDFSAAVLVTTSGYALLAGAGKFLAETVYEGVDEARARFGQYAKRLAVRYPELAEVAREYPPRLRSWGSPGEATPGSGVAEQVELMNRLDRDELTGKDFMDRWLAARRRSQEAGERLRRPLAEALDQVFYALEDYEPDPGLRDPDELSDEDLLDQVRAALTRLRELDRS
ncbi:colicin immunity domain-containing protein [Amycolatopsis sacchari]|uniref:colicin immunity domain-containing protein n=1 Tax=Amycolatopsis sacchari TaxID=115433 RepID=UPI003D723C8A